MPRALLACLLLVGCGVTSEDAQVQAPPGMDEAATHCELFIDKVVAYQGAHGLRAVRMWVKTVPARLDDQVVEVGFRHRVATANGRDAGWHDLRLTVSFGSSDYFDSPFEVSSDTGRTRWEGAFFVRTQSDAYYWFEPPGGGNFTFDTSTYDDVLAAMGKSYNYSSGIEASVWTQRDDLTYFNAQRCY